jgi:hypothetical protein
LLTLCIAFLIKAIKEVSFFHSFYAENFLKKRNFGFKKAERNGQTARTSRVEKAGKSGEKE